MLRFKWNFFNRMLIICYEELIQLLKLLCCSVYKFKGVLQQLYIFNETV